MAKLSLRIDFETGERVGPGKIALLEAVNATGSISAAGRAMGMSYRRAWQLVDSLNKSFREPVASAKPGGVKGGGASLTPFGREVVKRYRAMEREAERALRAHLRFLQAARDG